MKVVHINKGDCGGGANVAAHRISSALRKAGVDSTMLVENKKTKDPYVFSTSERHCDKISDFAHFVGERLYILPRERYYTMRYNFSIANFGRDISDFPLVREADIIHLHWVNQGFLSIKSLKTLASLGKPIVWTLHDMWPFTGGCHYAGTCLEFNEHCGYCPFLRNPDKTDLSVQQYKAKKELYSSMNLTVVSCSQWLNSLASCSALLSKKHCVSIPNPIDTSVFSPFDKMECRRQLGLPLDKKLVLFGAAKVTDIRKGFRYLEEALRIISDSFPLIAKEMELIIFGRVKGNGINIPSGFKTHNLDFIHDTQTLVKLYNAADVFVLPSLQDNLPNTVVESLACGTPVVGFRIGGVPEMVVHEKTGYLAEVKNSLSLANGIYATMFMDSNKQRQAIVEHARSLFGEDAVAQQYIKVYQDALK